MEAKEKDMLIPAHHLLSAFIYFSSETKSQTPLPFLFYENSKYFTAVPGSQTFFPCQDKLFMIKLATVMKKQQWP